MGRRRRGNSGEGSLGMTSGAAFSTLEAFALGVMERLGGIFHDRCPPARKKDQESCATLAGSGPAAHQYLAAMLLDDALAHPKSQAGALFAFSGKEWIEYPPHIFPLDAAGVVTNHDCNAPAML